ncbi:MAG: polysaccharide pyruvyl transferase family protein [Sphingomonadaceae bacterium]|uniref:polysaccharide pyruvyl transferase family protein n=1 Tax=Thermaurantiacus sp. TaxID=2820283 RepID=UPI00298F1FB4|nr:polysaccharide pyruvyl transferase family protein [Thermaurantiacus sp.]MCS6986100.1 polysaccharide pyruvyl transferase family protein [Sphingomonadaceae bacterium]MDW8414684.1 polysaccharide pyruvyl transferase family protein [Thermaurantiacus sp.]
MPGPLDIGLVWHSDRHSNLGVGALTEGNVALVREAARRVGVEPRFHLWQPADPGAPYVEGMAGRHELRQAYLWRPGGYARDIRRMDLLLDIGAGDSFTDVYPGRRFAMMIGTKLWARAARVPLVLSPQTIGPFTRRAHTTLARGAIRCATLVFARDAASLAEAHRLWPGGPHHLAADVAFALPYRPQAKGPGIRVGVNVSGLLYSGGYSGRDEFGLEFDYRAFTHRLVDALLAREGVTVELLSHATSEGLARDDDARAVAAVHERHPAARPVPPFASPSEAKSYISGLDFLVGARMHATIAAFSARVPVVPVSYSRKFEGLFGSLGYRWLVPHRGMTTEAALDFTLSAFARRTELARDIEGGLARIDGLLSGYVERLARLLAGIATRRG